MIKIISSDLYKLFRRKSFYVCAIIAMLMSVLVVISENQLLQFSNDMAPISADDANLNGISCMADGITSASTLLMIFMSMFVASEFSYGTIKNIASKGFSRWKIYLSKLCVGAFVTLVYIVLCGATTFTAASILWKVGEFVEPYTVQNMIQMYGLHALTQFASVALVIMIGFIVRSTGGTIAVNLVWLSLSETIIGAMNIGAKKFFNLKDIDLNEYYINRYAVKFASYTIPSDIITKGVIVCVCYIVVTTIIGMYVFHKRDIK